MLIYIGVHGIIVTVVIPLIVLIVDQMELSEKELLWSLWQSSRQ